MPDEAEPLDAEAELDRLFAGDPGAFTAGRDALAARARKAGERGLANRIKALRRPTAAAWVANLLAREEAGSVRELLDLGEALRAAHQTLSAEELRPLAAQRTAVVEALTRRAARLAAEHGHPTSEPVRSEVASTLQAALADPEVAEELRRARLTRAASYSGFGLAPAHPRREPEPVSSLDQARSRRRSRQEREAEQARIRAIQDARRHLQQTESALVEAESLASAVEEEHLAAAEELDRRSQEVADLRAELEQAEAAEQEAHQAAEATQQRLDEATEALEQARAEQEEAQQQLDALAAATDDDR
ncbi:hypothetical protein GC722_02150 [Auraticoccus sp. F435]|uniref:Uncharacterized protein n=1 Tax=Auraticoccus cholistanensis TaxID=2656650 RepID=A0A6A9UQ90_9ACTN|nr:hypothetical protein [Auraticoccus cholistanensis]MVA74841.1 hypothetical protein [Auraticoccus cholistanensis]